MKKLPFILFFSLLLLSCKSQNSGSIGNYTVNPQLKEEVSKYTFHMNGVPMGNMEIRLYEDDKIVFDNFGKENEKAELLYMIFRQGDTIEITGFVGFAMAIGFYLDLFGDNYELTYLEKADSEIYKYNESDTKLTYKLSVPCSYTSCILTEKPTFKKEDPIAGMVELKSNDFWRIANGKKNKYRVELKAYFTTKLLKEEE